MYWPLLPSISKTALLWAAEDANVLPKDGPEAGTRWVARPGPGWEWRRRRRGSDAPVEAGRVGHRDVGAVPGVGVGLGGEGVSGATGDGRAAGPRGQPLGSVHGCSLCLDGCGALPRESAVDLRNKPPSGLSRRMQARIYSCTHFSTQTIL